MNIIETIHQSIMTHLENQYALPEQEKKSIEIALNSDEKKQQFGDISTNAALIIAHRAGKNPRVLAQEIVTMLKHPLFERIEIAGPGFINIFLTSHAFKQLAQELYTQHDDFFKPHGLKPLTYSLEFVSANPTGPLHIGHGRGGIVGDVLARILRFLGHAVTTEFYINDAGNQIQRLGVSFKIRIEQLLGIHKEIPEDGYHGEYLIELARQCISEFGNDLLNKPDSFFEQYAQDHILKNIKVTLEKYGVIFDVWFSEKTLHQKGAIKQALELLQLKKYVYEKDGALWFASTLFGDDKDRVVRKSSGELTYAAADIAYIQSKLERGADHLLMVLGQDHHSYVVRLKAIMQALGYDPQRLDVILYQLVTIKQSGELVRLSKRAGNIVSLEDIIDIVGKDVARFFYLHRKVDAHLDFDLALALEHSEKNPVYYIQYAYVRAGSILEKAAELQEFSLDAHDVQYLSAAEAVILKKIASLKSILETINTTYQTHLLAYYCLELAHSFHHYYAHNKVIIKEDIELTKSRLLVITLIRQTFKLVMDLLGISAPRSM